MRPHRRYSEEEKRVLLNTVAQEQSNQPLSWILAELRAYPLCLLRLAGEGGNRKSG